MNKWQQEQARGMQNAAFPDQVQDKNKLEGLLEKLESQVAAASATVNILEDRLRFILKPEGPEKPMRDALSPVPGSSFSAAIIELSGRVNNIEGHLSSIIQRLDL